jgi:hypothetical protein
MPEEVARQATGGGVLVQYQFPLCATRSPFEALYGIQPQLLGLQPPTAADGKLEEWLAKRAGMNQLIRQHLVRVHERMKKQDDKKRSERQFNVGTMVYMKLQPYVQSSVRPRVNQKLSIKYFGPFRIVEHVGSVAYRLQLPDHSVIHPLVHVSQLKLVVGFKGPVSSQLPTDSVQFCVPVDFRLEAGVPWRGLGFPGVGTLI